MKILIVGQGLAGTTLGYRLERAGHRVHYTDAPGQTAASAVAAGIVNPITGRHFVKSWRIEELLPAARALYGELEDTLGLKLWYDQPLLRTLYNRGDVNSWEARAGDPGYADYLEDDPDPGRLPELTAPVFAYAGVRHAARVDVAGLVTAYRKKLEEEGRITYEEFDYRTIPTLLGADAGAGQGPGRGAVRYDRVVCCTGWRARHSPWFSYLPHGGNKGEVLIVRTTAPALDRMFKHRVFLVPLTEDTYWVGATSDNRFTDDGATETNRSFLADRLSEILTGTAYEIIAHRAAVRPTVRDRRMFLGEHPALAGLFIFNGLGTKGASLAPLGSRWLTDHMLNGAALPAEVDIARYAGLRAQT